MSSSPVMIRRPSKWRWLRAVVLLLLPGRLAAIAANWLGYSTKRGARIGLSWIAVDHLTMAEGASIRHGNVIAGPFSVELAEHASIGHLNTIKRGPIGVSHGPSCLRLGIWTGITTRHRLDLCASITIGDYSTVAGAGSQLWTHGYVHELEGLARYRIDGAITIGNNVYIGTMCFISMGVAIGSGVIVGGGTAVARDLPEPGLYVSGPLRQLPRPPAPEQRPDLVAVPEGLTCERVFTKHRPD